MRIRDFLKTPVPRPHEVKLVGGAIAALAALYAVSGPLVIPLYLISYPFAREAQAQGTTIQSLICRQLPPIVTAYIVDVLVCLTAVALLRLHRWGRVLVEALLWAFAAYTIYVAAHMFATGPSWVIALATTPVCWWSLFYYWIHLPALFVPLGYLAVPLLAIRLLHRPAVAAAIRAAEAARRGEPPTDAHAPTDPQH